MKKVIGIIGIFISFIIIYLLQANFFNWFNIAGIQPNLFIILVLFVGLYAGKKMGLAMGIVIGLLLDLIIGQTIGLTAVMLGIIGMIGDYLDKSFTKENRITIMFMVMIITLIYEIGLYILKVFVLQMPFEPFAFIKITSIEIIYNTILTIILYPILQTLGETLELIYKKPDILTRYV